MNITGVMVQYYAGGSYGSSRVSEELNSVETGMFQCVSVNTEKVSEELNSVKTLSPPLGGEKSCQFQKNLIVWKQGCTPKGVT